MEEKKIEFIKKIKKLSQVLFMISAICGLALLYGFLAGMDNDRLTFLVFPLLISGSLLIALHEGLLPIVTGKVTVNIFQEVSDQPLISKFIGLIYLIIGLLGFIIGTVLFIVLYVIPFFMG